MSQNYLFGDAKATAREADVRRKQKALEAAQKAYEADHSPQAQAALATALFDIGKLQEAEQLLSSMLREYGDNLQVLCDLAFILKNLNRPEEASRMFLRIVELSPKHALARCAEQELWMMDPSYKPSWMRK